jgi:hypothetical protein
MKPIFKAFFLSLLLCLLPDFGGVRACFSYFEPDRYAYQAWLFHIDLIPTKALHALNYPSLQRDYYKNLSSGNVLGKQFDTTSYAQNVAEWKAQLAKDPAIKEKVTHEDIYEILYGMYPEHYFMKRKNDGLRQNSFMRAILSAKAPQSLLNYLDFAKICERLMSDGSPWDEQHISFKDHIAKGDSILRQPSLPRFVQERVAYQVIKMAHYANDSTHAKQVFKQFIEKSTSKSWIIGAAHYYEAMAQADPAIRNLHLARTFDLSIDKRWQSLQNFDQSSAVRKKAFALAQTPQDKLRLMMMSILMYDGRSLTDLKKTYQTDAQNPLLLIAMQREINKLENWIFTNRFTDYAVSAASGEVTEPWAQTVTPSTPIIARNLRSDLHYLEEVLAFVQAVASEKKQPNSAYWSLAAAHLAFLKKDFVTAKQYLEAVKAEKGVSTATQLQTYLTELLCDLYSAPRLSEEDDKAVLKFDAFLQANKTKISDYQDFRSQIMRFLSDRYIADGQTAKGILILSKSSLVFGELGGLWEKNFYHLLLEKDDAPTIQTVLNIINPAQKNQLSAFDRWLASEPKGYKIDRYSQDDSIIVDKNWDIEALKDYQSMIYVRHDALDSAYAVAKLLPPSRWTKYPYSDYTKGNPFQFYTDAYHDSEGLSQQKIAYSKPNFLKKMMELKQELKNNPKKYEQNYFLIGMAYYNMTNYGNYWLLSQIYWNGYHVEKETQAFKDNYFGCKRALEWFAKGAKVCQNKEYAAMCCFMANQCKNQQDEYRHFLKYDAQTDGITPDFVPTKTPLWKDLNKRFKETASYEEKEYWCQHLDSLSASIDTGYIKRILLVPEVPRQEIPVEIKTLSPKIDPMKTHLFNFFISVLGVICVYLLRHYLRP